MWYICNIAQTNDKYRALVSNREHMKKNTDLILVGELMGVCDSLTIYFAILHKPMTKIEL